MPAPGAARTPPTAPMGQVAVEPPPGSLFETVDGPLGRPGDEQIHRSSRWHPVGGEEPVGFELSRRGQPIARDSDEEIKARLKAQLAA